MAYAYSKTDTKNLSWFKNDVTNESLIGIRLTEGRLRGLDRFKVEFQYPISVFSGKNGSGKSTMLALAACAYHNADSGYRLPIRRSPYYTFSDFFIQSSSEIPPQGIKIYYQILSDKWAVSKRLPDGKGLAVQQRKKKTGGKWNDYSRRMPRNVVFLGIDRVVPYSEKTVFKSYRRHFKKVSGQHWQKDVKDAVGRIIGKIYDDFWFIEHGKYRIPVVQIGAEEYSGFNMGAGENALFEVFSIIHSCPKGALIVIDEIELGLHQEAQKLFIDELKNVCLSRKVQIIATTHSSAILQRLPPESRFHIESFASSTVITPGISASFAGGKLAGENSNELDIFVEDKVAAKILELALSTEIRNRINIVVIGSSSAISRQMAARYKNLKQGECLAIMDGDKRKKISEHNSVFKDTLEEKSIADEAKNWFVDRLEYLPGNTWPESWVINELKTSDCSMLTHFLTLSKEELVPIFDKCLLAGKHNEFHTLANSVNLDVDLVSSICAKQIIQLNEFEFKKLEKVIQMKLNMH